MFQTMVHSVNGHCNTQIEEDKEFVPDLAFARFIRVLRAFQKRNALVISVGKSKPEGSDVEKVQTTLRFRTDLVGDRLIKDLQEAKEMVGLHADATAFTVIAGTVPPDNMTLVLEMRSLLQFMVVLSADVEVPEPDLAAGRVERLKPRPKEDMSGLEPLMTVRSGESRPSSAFVACRYRGWWFWIEDTDVNSKRTFAYLRLLSTLGEADDKGTTPLVITTN
jgi:hypothetical protein